MVVVAHVCWLLIAGMYALSVTVLGLDEVRRGELAVGEWAVALGVTAVVLGCGVVGLTIVVTAGIRAGSTWLRRVTVGSLITILGLVVAVAFLATNR